MIALFDARRIHVVMTQVDSANGARQSAEAGPGLRLGLDPSSRIQYVQNSIRKMYYVSFEYRFERMPVLPG